MMEIRYKQLLTSPILLLLLVIVAQSAEKLQEQQQQKSQEESSLETLEADRLKRASGMKENSDGGIIIDVNNGDYPNENYYYDNYDFSNNNNNNNENNNVERPSTSFNLNNTYKVESHVLNDDNEDVVDDSGAAVVHIESGTSGKKKPTVPPFIPNESDDSGAGLRIMDPIDEDDDGDDTYGGADDESDAGIIKIDSPPQFKPSQQQTFNTDKTALNNNRGPSKSSDLTTKSTSQQRFQADYKLVLIAGVLALTGLVLLLAVTLFACYRCRGHRNHGFSTVASSTSKPTSPITMKTSKNKQYVAVDQA